MPFPESPPGQSRQRAIAIDPTYDPAEIAANPVWTLAFRLSAFDNDEAPIGWSSYLPLARFLLATYDVREKDTGREALTPAPSPE